MIVVFPDNTHLIVLNKQKYVGFFFRTPDKDIIDILSWDNKQAVTGGLYIGCIGTLAYGRQVTWLLSSSDAIITCASQSIQELLGAFFKYKMQYLMVSKKNNSLFM